MKTKRTLSFWIKERHNPQLGVYYVALGQLTVKEAKEHESPSYGTNYLHRFPSREACAARMEELKTAGHRVQ